VLGAEEFSDGWDLTPGDVKGNNQ